jgi:hypothetical protein
MGAAALPCAGVNLASKLTENSTGLLETLSGLGIRDKSGKMLRLRFWRWTVTFESSCCIWTFRSLGQRVLAYELYF